MELIGLIGGGLSLLALAIAWVPLRRWIAKCKRRKGGVYIVKVDKHSNRARRHIGYVGESVNFYLRKRQHLGASRFDPVTGAVVKGRGPGVPMVKIPAQPWSDLNPIWSYIRLPWWLCWKWVLRPAETLVMLLTWPVYNDAKNHWNPRRITKSMAQLQRRQRDEGGMIYRGRVSLAHGARIAVQVAGALVVLVGAYGWMMTR